MPNIDSNPFRLSQVLLVDDDDELCHSIKELLEAKNYMVTLAHNGVTALREVMKREFDIVLCDLMMPNMAGDMFYKAVERVKPSLCKRFIFITGYENHPQFSKFIKETQPVVLYKPVTLGKLMGTITLLSKKTQTSR